MLEGSLGCSAGVCVRGARCGDGVDVFDFFTVLVDDDAAAAVRCSDAVAGGTKVKDLR